MTPTGADPARLPRVFVDADVVVAGAASATGASHLVLQLGEIGLLEVVASAQVREEAEGALVRKLPAALPAFRSLAEVAVEWLPDPAAEALQEHAGDADPKDLPILVAAIHAGADVLLTFNTRHYHRRTPPPRIERPGVFLQRLRALLEELAGPEEE